MINNHDVLDRVLATARGLGRPNSIEKATDMLMRGCSQATAGSSIVNRFGIRNFRSCQDELSSRDALDRVRMSMSVGMSTRPTSCQASGTLPSTP